MRRGGESGVEQKQKSEGLEPATLGEADPLGAGHDEVIQDPHIDQGQSVLEPGSDGAISLGGLTSTIIEERMEQSRSVGKGVT